jgi:hypothetical protein
MADEINNSSAVVSSAASSSSSNEGVAVQHTDVTSEGQLGQHVIQSRAASNIINEVRRDVGLEPVSFLPSEASGSLAYCWHIYNVCLFNMSIFSENNNPTVFMHFCELVPLTWMTLLKTK